MNFEKEYDEMQLKNRFQMSFYTMVFFLAELLINGCVREFCPQKMWAEPLTEMIVLLFLPFFFFYAGCLWKNAYVPRYQKNYHILMVLILITGLLNGIPFLYDWISGSVSWIENGLLSRELNRFFTALFLCFISILYFFHEVWEKRKNRGEE